MRAVAWGAGLIYEAAVCGDLPPARRFVDTG
jgi:hypothetical protein